nr:MAG TPA: hypothetical protein [Caudoviricetes sp.]
MEDINRFYKHFDGTLKNGLKFVDLALFVSLINDKDYTTIYFYQNGDIEIKTFRYVISGERLYSYEDMYIVKDNLYCIERVRSSNHSNDDTILISKRVFKYNISNNDIISAYLEYSREYDPKLIKESARNIARALSLKGSIFAFEEDTLSIEICPGIERCKKIVRSTPSIISNIPDVLINKEYFKPELIWSDERASTFGK